MTGAEIAIIAVAAAGTVVSYQSAKTQGKFQMAAAERERIAAEEAGDRAKLQALRDQEDLLVEAAAAGARRRVQAAALGIDPYGSRNLLAMERQADRQLTDDMQVARYNALVRVRQYEMVGSAAEAAGLGAKAAADSQKLGAIMELGGTVASVGAKGGWFDKAKPKTKTTSGLGTLGKPSQPR
jgi:hypothetical protein